MTNKKTPNKAQIERLLARRKQHESQLNPELITEKILRGDKTALSDAITLIENKIEAKRTIGQTILSNCLPHSGKSIRIGITGVPGVGKSSFIEAFGTHLTEQGCKVAVLAIDPSSEISKGSILGDKTRMIELSANPNAFIRPTATSGSLGGVAHKTRETILLCEAAGFDTILVETVGVGQSETEVHSMTDFFLLLMLAGAGDELQGIKRGIMEMADTILITKADGKNVKPANLARTEYKNALHLFPAKENNWIPKVETVSAMENRGLDKIWKIIKTYDQMTHSNGWKDSNRKAQQEYWMKESIQSQILEEFYQTKGIQDKIKEITNDLNVGKLTSYQAAELIIKYYKKQK
ncbi:methylmalonyl Co-A mutase-associated GTPase MeaB [Crocinitomix algicola]|uniref:methylmalonyl Co-A mutase-associated GTPase MeaB n=1 Tax=Crocinitomix algicola TaxID=1740263 RepID=UPI0009F3152E|nr:methylmalonyl Co-A mutase-associated GTPase MeaB [Crocinitomix algicola]